MLVCICLIKYFKSDFSLVPFIIKIIKNKETESMFEKVIVIDARGHLLGRLASVIAKSLLLG